ncbi:MAG: WD40 repeat domain-containing protein [Allorhizobium sp.]
MLRHRAARCCGHYGHPVRPRRCAPCVHALLTANACARARAPVCGGQRDCVLWHHARDDEAVHQVQGARILWCAGAHLRAAPVARSHWPRTARPRSPAPRRLAAGCWLGLVGGEGVHLHAHAAALLQGPQAVRRVPPRCDTPCCAAPRHAMPRRAMPCRAISPRAAALTSSLCMRAWVRRAVHATMFSSDNVHIVSASDDRTVAYWDLATGGCLASMRGHKARVCACAGARLQASPLTPRRRWRRARAGLRQVAGAVAVRPRGTPRRAACVQPAVTSHARAPPLQMYVSGSYDHTVRLWDMRTQGTSGHSGACARMRCSRRRRCC